MGADPLLGAGAEALSQYLEHGKIEDWGRVGSAGGGGIAGGLIAVSNPAAALSTVMSAGAGSSALAGVTERLIASGGKSAGTLTEVAVDAATGAGSAGIVKGGASLLRKVLPKKVAPPASKGPVAKAQSVTTPWGGASQSSAPAALAAREQAAGGARLYRLGTLGKSNTHDAQFWALEHPFSPGFGQRYGIPSENIARSNFVETGVLKQNASFVTRPAPGVGTNTGGGIEVVVDAGGVKLQGFTMQ